MAQLRGVEFCLEGDGTALARHVTAAPPDVVIECTVGDASRASWTVCRILSTQVDAPRRRIAMELTDWQATFDLDDRRVVAHLPGPWPLALDSLLRTTAQLFAIATGKALLFHGSSVVRDGVAYVFLGPSGAGKTTSALLSVEAGATILGEEYACVGGIGSGRPRAYTLPFRQRTGLLTEPQAHPLAALYWLQQAADDEVLHVSPSRQLTCAVRAVTIGVRHELLMEPAVDLCAALLRTVPVDVLRFRESREFWRAIEADRRGAGVAR